MNTTATAREARTRNLARLRQLTIGTAALGVAATTGFGYLATMTYTGTNAVASVTSTANTAFATTATSGASPAPLVTTTTQTAHVRSGGS